MAAQQYEDLDDEIKQHLEKTANLLKDDKVRKFQHDPDASNRTFVSASQSTACRSEKESQEDEVQEPLSSFDLTDPGPEDCETANFGGAFFKRAPVTPGRHQSMRSRVTWRGSDFHMPNTKSSGSSSLAVFFLPPPYTISAG